MNVPAIKKDAHGMNHFAKSSRRTFLQLAGATVAGSVGSAAARTQAEQSEYPPSVGVKFAKDGRVISFPGNTLICHLDQQGEHAGCFNALLNIYRDAAAEPFMKEVTLLPPSSYHMTVFGAADDFNRRPGDWPNGVPLDLPIAECHQIMAERLREFRLACPLPLRMRVNLTEPDADARPLRLRLLPIDDAENRKIRDLRDRLSTALGIRNQNHETYEFHITLGYLIRWLSADEERAFRTTLRRWRENVAARCPVIDLGAPEYCTFEDMFAFRRLFYLT
jgi:hypothetical protein